MGTKMTTTEITKATKATKKSLIKSKDRVRERGEVFTAPREVKAMLDLIPKTSPGQTYLEPACGTGNFLVEILRRKLKAHPLTAPYYDNVIDGKINPIPVCDDADIILSVALRAVSSMYGIDICPQNVQETNLRLYSYVIYGEDYFDDGVPSLHDAGVAGVMAAILQKASARGALVRPKRFDFMLQSALRTVLRQNIQQGDFLTCEDAAGEPLVVVKWGFSDCLDPEITAEGHLLSNVGVEGARPVNTLLFEGLSNFHSAYNEDYVAEGDLYRHSSPLVVM